MTLSQKLTIRLSSCRQKLNDLLGVEERSDEQNTELETLTAEVQKTEPELRAAIAAEGEEVVETTVEKPEDRERRELRGKARLSKYIGAAITGRLLDGAEKEAAEAFNCPGMVPLQMFERREAQEDRAITPSPSTSDENLARPIVPAIFQRSAAAWLGIDMPSVGVGDAGYVVLGTSLTGGPQAKSATAAETAGAFTVTTAAPRRVTGSFRFTREDAARLAGMEEALSSNLSAVLSDGVDNQAVNGSGTGDGTINGLLNRLTDPGAPAANAETFARYVTAFGSHVDGTFAVDLSGVRALLGPQTYRHMVGRFRANEDAMTAQSWAAANTGGLRVSARIAAPASNIQQAIIRRTNPVGDSVAVMPVWSGLELIRDPYSDAAKGEVTVTGIILVGDVIVLRSGAFVQDSFRLA